jgi:hypothetical protein
MTRLESQLPDLADKLRRASTAKQRAASVAASEFAIARAKVEHPLVMRAMEKVRATGVLTAKEKAELDALVAQLDGEYFDSQEAAEEGRAAAGDYIRPFGQARAVAALSFAGNDDALEAATEAIYEAAAATDDKEQLSALVQSVLR